MVAKTIETDSGGVRRQFRTYENDADLLVSIDLLVNGVTSQQTDETWRYDLSTTYG